MSKPFEILVLYAFLLIYAQSLTIIEPEKIPFSQSQTQIQSNQLKNYSKMVEIKANVEYHQGMVVGYNGTFLFVSEYNDEILNIFDPETIEQETSFSTVVIDENQQIHNTNCKLWKPTKTIRIMCDANFNEKGSHSVSIIGKYFEYKNEYLINVTFFGDKKFTFDQVDMYIPFIYSYEQKINLNDDIPLYELKFKFNSYYDEILYIYGAKDNYAILDNCEKSANELICKISKEKIEEKLIFNNETFRLAAIKDTFGVIYLDPVFPIIINHGDVQKEDIFVQLVKLVGGITEIGTPFALETNITQISNLISAHANIIPNATCYFKKMTGKPLMLLVEYNFEGENIAIQDSQKELIYNDIHYKYNFLIQPFKIKETFSIKNRGNKVLLTYPENIDFTASEHKLIRFIMTNPYLANEIKLNPDSKTDLNCRNYDIMKICEVEETHFSGKKSGTYKTYHKNHANNLNIYYDAPLINVTLTQEPFTELPIKFEDNQKTKYIGYQGILIL